MSKKSRPDLVPARLTEAAATALACGTYPDRGWRVPGPKARPGKRAASIERHWLAYKRGEYRDVETGLPHLYCVAAQLGILIDLVEDPPDVIQEEDERWHELVIRIDETPPPDVDEHGTRRWFDAAGQLHRDDGPAVVYASGSEYWYQHGDATR